MKFLVVGDPHIKPGNLDMAKQLFGMVEEFGLPVIWLGDMLDTKELIRGKCLNAFFDYFTKSKLQHRVLVGNHDWFNLDCVEHSLETLKSLENVLIMDFPETTVGQPKDQILFFPYMHDLSKFRETLKEYGPRKILFMHQGVNGFDFGNGFLEEFGIGLEELKQFELVVSGHFHKRQENSNLIYPGTPFSQSQGEANQKKYLMTLDTDTLAVEWIETPFPQHITLEVSTEEELTKAMKDIDPKNYLRVILNGTKEQLIKFDKSKFETVRFVERESNEIFETNALNETQSNEKKFQIWATQTKLDPATIALGLEILKGAQ